MLNYETTKDNKNGCYPFNYYPFLDGFRGVAILAVMSAHAQNFFHAKDFSGLLFKFLVLVGPLGHLGVDMFFVISGFLITGILIRNYRDPIDVRRFYVRRIFKIIPPYASLILMTMLMVPFDEAGKWNIGHLGPYVLFTQNYAPYVVTPLAHTWSLSIEEHFYLIFPLIVAAIFCLAKSEDSRRRCILGLGLAIMAFTILFRDILHDTRFFIFSNLGPDFTQTTLFRADALMFGCVLRVMEPYYAHGMDKVWRVLSPVLLLCGLIIYYYFSQNLDQNGFIICRAKFIFSYIAPGLLLLGIYRGGRWLRRVFENNVLRWVGKNSYGIYLWHYVLITLLASSLMLYLRPTLAVVAFYVLSMIAGWLSTITVERYALKLRHRLCP